MNVVHALEAHADSRPDDLALDFAGRTWTYGQVNAEISRLASGLRQLGIARGDRVGVMLPNWPEFHLGSHAAWKLGAIEVPINTEYKGEMLRYITMVQPEEIRYVLRDSGAKAVLAFPEAVERILKVRDELPDLGAIVVVGGEAPPGTVAITEVMANDDTSLRGPDLDGDDLAIIAYTSGTTGFPKGSMLGHYHVEVSMARLRDWLGIDHRDNVLQVLPCFHSNASMIGIVFAWYLGSTAILVERFDPAEFAATVRRTRPSFFAGVPTVLFDIMNLPDEVEVDFSSVKYVTYGAAPAPPQVRRRVEERFGLKLRQAWGMTEGPNLVTVDAKDGPIAYDGVGLPLSHIEVVAVDESDRVLGPGEVGELCLQGKTDGPDAGVYRPMLGYWNNPEATAQALANGRFHTGDVGYVDADGVVYLVDRKKDMIIRGGNNIFPAEIERVLVEDPRVSEAYVIGIPHERLGEVPKAYVVPEDGQELTEDDVRAIVREKLAAFKRVEAVTFLRADELPRNALGKVLKRELRGMAI